MPLSPDVILLLVLAAFAAGFVDAIAGGGGLITLPSLLMAGLSPVEAIATNKFQGTFGVATSSFAFWRAGVLDLPALLPAVAATLAGAALGSISVLHMDAAWLSKAMPVLLIGVALYFAFAPAARAPMQGAAITPLRWLAPGLGFIIGFYDGFFGPGTGSFFLLGFSALGGLGLMTATANTKLLNFSSNLASFIVFALSGKIIYAVGGFMIAGQVAGAWLGARSALAQGARIIRPMAIAVSLAIAVKLLLEPS